MLKIKKKVIALLLSSSISVLSTTSCGASTINRQGSQEFNGREITVTFNDQEIEFDQNPIMKDDRTYVPFRQIFETMGTVIFYKDDTKEILGITRDSDVINHTIGTNYAIINEQIREFDSSSFIENDRTLVPARFIAELLCAEIDYKEDENKVEIIKPITYNQYHGPIKEILDCSVETNFNPLKFKRYLTYKANHPDLSNKDVILNVNMNLDYSFYTNINEIINPHDLLVLCNKYNKLASDFSPYNIVSFDSGYYSGNGRYINDVAKIPFQNMVNAGRQAGVSMKSVSSLRTNNYQAGLYNSSVNRNGKNHADKYSARAGHSEHQTGLAIDINNTSTSFENTKEFKWLKNNAHNYGFILRYPKGKEWIHGYGYEPWHYRYVGAEVATKIYNEGITFEEFCAKYIKQHDYNINIESTNEKVLSKY